MIKNAVIKLVFLTFSIIVLNWNVSGQEKKKAEIEPFSMTMEEVVAEMKPYYGTISKEQVETNTVLGKVMCGYQGWFRAPGDGSGQGWVHWGRGSEFNPKMCTIDYWPDTGELTDEEKYPTEFKYKDGSTAYVFSSVNKKTVLRHFEWMKEAGIHGVFLQRFINGTEPAQKLYGYTKVLENVREGANTHGRSWALMYDMSGAQNADRAIQLFKTDWKRLIDNMKLGKDPHDKAYQHHNGKPLVAIWGLFENREGMPEFYNEIIDFVKNDPVYGGFSVMIGSENHWRYGEGEKYEILREAIKKADIISPWTVGRYRTPDIAEEFIKRMHGPDIAWCKENNIDFLPVIYPGFSWHNLKAESPLDQIPRLQGQFFWRQVYENLHAGAKMFYVAMFDEVDEGTAIFKVDQNPPVGESHFLNYNGLPSDHYMWLAGKAQEALQNKLKAEKTPPLRPGVTFIIDSKDTIANAQPAQWALQQLKDALNGQGVKSNVNTKLADTPENNLCVVVAGSTNKMALYLLEKQRLSIPNTPEAVGLVRGNIDGREVLLVSGSDARGLVYALLELADRIQCGIKPTEALKVPKPVIEKPAVKVRSIYRTFTSETEDKGWYNDREFWSNYLTELATQRVNRFSLALGMGYNSPNGVKDSYLFFAYPFLVQVPGYNVQAVGLPDKERDSNLEMLKFISNEAAARGIEFQLALWSQGKDFGSNKNVNYPIQGLSDEDHAKYCRDALAIILKACPSISGVTFRVHYESGIPRGEEDFWKVLFQAFHSAGRPIWIDMHGKQITQEQILSARATGMPVSVSPKYWGEHMGLAYHQSDIRRREKGNVKFVEPASGVFTDSRIFTRYGYGDLLPDDRDWEVLHRIWPGTQRLLLSGDPALAAGYGNVSGFSGSLGVERLDPLTFKGRRGSGHPGGRCAYADKSLEPKWDFQKYLYTYRLWGRLVYNPNTDPEVWRRYLRKEFQEAAESVEIALANSSRVLYLITTAHGPSGDCLVYWPEIYRNQPIVDSDQKSGYRDTDNPPFFGNVSPFDPQLFSKMNEYAAALLERVSLAKYSPLEVARWLDDMADISTTNLEKAASLVNDNTSVEFRRLQADVKIQCGIARFFAQKMRSAVLWHLFEGSGNITALNKAIEKYTNAREIWAEMAEEAKSVYVSDISFGDLEPLRGHWADRVPAMDEDIANMKKALAEASENQSNSKQTIAIKEALQIVETPPRRVEIDCLHTPAEIFQPGKTMAIELTLADGKTHDVYLYYRHLNQAVDWHMVSMKKKGEQYQAEIPGNYTQTRYPMEYYFAIDMGKEGIAIYPGLDDNLANMPYYVVRQKR